MMRPCQHLSSEITSFQFAARVSANRIMVGQVNRKFFIAFNSQNSIDGIRRTLLSIEIPS